MQESRVVAPKMNIELETPMEQRNPEALLLLPRRLFTPLRRVELKYMHTTTLCVYGVVEII